MVDRLLPACTQPELLYSKRSPPHIGLLCSHSDPILVPRARDSSLVDVACVKTLIQRAGRYHLNPQRAKFLSPPPTSRQSLQLRSLRLRFSREAVSSSTNPHSAVAI